MGGLCVYTWGVQGVSQPFISSACRHLFDDRCTQALKLAHQQHPVCLPACLVAPLVSPSFSLCVCVPMGCSLS